MSAVTNLHLLRNFLLRYGHLATFFCHFRHKEAHRAEPKSRSIWRVIEFKWLFFHEIHRPEALGLFIPEASYWWDCRLFPNMFRSTGELQVIQFWKGYNSNWLHLRIKQRYGSGTAVSTCSLEQLQLLWLCVKRWVILLPSRSQGENDPLIFSVKFFSIIGMRASKSDAMVSSPGDLSFVFQLVHNFTE